MSRSLVSLNQYDMSVLIDNDVKHVLHETEYDNVTHDVETKKDHTIAFVVNDDNVKNIVRKRFYEHVVGRTLDTYDVFPKSMNRNNTQCHLFLKTHLTKWDMGRETGDGFAYPHRFFLKNNRVNDTDAPHISNYLERMGADKHVDCFVKTANNIYEPLWISFAKTRSIVKKTKNIKIVFSEKYKEDYNLLDIVQSVATGYRDLLSKCSESTSELKNALNTNVVEHADNYEKMFEEISEFIDSAFVFEHKIDTSQFRNILEEYIVGKILLPSCTRSSNYFPTFYALLFYNASALESKKTKERVIYDFDKKRHVHVDRKASVYSELLLDDTKKLTQIGLEANIVDQFLDKNDLFFGTVSNILNDIDIKTNDLGNSFWKTHVPLIVMENVNKNWENAQEWVKTPGTLGNIEEMTTTLEQMMNTTNTSLLPSLILDVLSQTCDALSEPQEKFNFEHGDLHTQNVLVTQRRLVKKPVDDDKNGDDNDEPTPFFFLFNRRETNAEYSYYSSNKITIIDFGRSSYDAKHYKNSCGYHYKKEDNTFSKTANINNDNELFLNCVSDINDYEERSNIYYKDAKYTVLVLNTMSEKTIREDMSDTSTELCDVKYVEFNTDRRLNDKRSEWLSTFDPASDILYLLKHLIEKDVVSWFQKYTHFKKNQILVDIAKKYEEYTNKMYSHLINDDDKWYDISKIPPTSFGYDHYDEYGTQVRSLASFSTIMCYKTYAHVLVFILYRIPYKKITKKHYATSLNMLLNPHRGMWTMDNMAKYYPTSKATNKMRNTLLKITTESRYHAHDKKSFAEDFLSYLLTVRKFMSYKPENDAVVYVERFSRQKTTTESMTEVHDKVMLSNVMYDNFKKQKEFSNNYVSVRDLRTPNTSVNAYKVNNIKNDFDFGSFQDASYASSLLMRYEELLIDLKNDVARMIEICKNTIKDFGVIFFDFDTKLETTPKDKKKIYSGIASEIMKPIPNFKETASVLNLSNVANKMLFKQHLYNNNREMFDAIELDKRGDLKGDKTMSFYAMLWAFLKFTKTHETHVAKITPILAKGNVIISELSIVSKHIVAFVTDPGVLRSGNLFLLNPTLVSLSDLQKKIYDAVFGGGSFYATLFDAYKSKLKSDAKPDFDFNDSFSKTNRHYRNHFAFFLKVLKTHTILEHAYFSSFLRFKKLLTSSKIANNPSVTTR